MSSDTLSSVLRAIRLRGAIFYHVDGVAPWVAEAPAGAEIIPAIFPGVDHLMEFHAVARGACWAGIVGEPPVRLETGDLVIFPQGDPHVIASRPGLRTGRSDLGAYYAPRPPQLPYDMRMSLPEAALPDEPSAVIVCGFIGCDARPFNPLLASLPRTLHVAAAASGRTPWLGSVLQAVVEESQARRSGGEAVLERMTEVLFVEALRRYIETLDRADTGWLAGLGDAALGRALALLHERPGEPWTLDRLGEAAAVSRTTLHERFVHYLGQPPMQYLAQWRMQLASQRLRDTDATVLEIALDVGYENEAAFARAFRRATGESPAAWRRQRRASTGRRGGVKTPAPSRRPRPSA